MILAAMATSPCLQEQDAWSEELELGSEHIHSHVGLWNPNCSQLFLKSRVT